MVSTHIRRGLPLLVAFVLGASVVGVASGHEGSPGFLHSGHADTMKGTLRAQNFRFLRPRVSYVVIAPASIQPLDSSDCTGFERQENFVSAPAGCEMIAQVNPPNHSFISKVVWNLRADSATNVELELVSYDALGNEPPKVVAGAGEITPVAECETGCAVSYSAFPEPGVNPVVTQRRTYSVVVSADQPIKTTRIFVRTEVDTPGPL
jgi:hypothetical protein